MVEWGAGAAFCKLVLRQRALKIDFGLAGVSEDRALFFNGEMSELFVDEIVLFGQIFEGLLFLEALLLDKCDCALHVPQPK